MKSQPKHFLKGKRCEVGIYPPRKLGDEWTICLSRDGEAFMGAWAKTEELAIEKAKENIELWDEEFKDDKRKLTLEEAIKLCKTFLQRGEGQTVKELIEYLESELKSEEIKLSKK